MVCFFFLKLRKSSSTQACYKVALQKLKMLAKPSTLFRKCCRRVFLVIVVTNDLVEVKECLLDVLKLAAPSGACTGALNGQGLCTLGLPPPSPQGQRK